MQTTITETVRNRRMDTIRKINTFTNADNLPPIRIKTEENNFEKRKKSSMEEDYNL